MMRSSPTRRIKFRCMAMNGTAPISPSRPELWHRLFWVLKPRRLHRHVRRAPALPSRRDRLRGCRIHLYPFMGWRFRDGLPKPINLAELFDRDNLDEREVIGIRRGSGFTTANVEHGAQNRTHTMFAEHARHVSQEAQAWRGVLLWGERLETLPGADPAGAEADQHGRSDRQRTAWGTGALNVGALQDRYGVWPDTILTHRKAQKARSPLRPSQRQTSPADGRHLHLVCPGGGRILDPFAGTGSTGVAAKQLNFDCVLIEQDATMQPIIDRRVLRERDQPIIADPGRANHMRNVLSQFGCRTLRATMELLTPLRACTSRCAPRPERCHLRARWSDGDAEANRLYAARSDWDRPRQRCHLFDRTCTRFSPLIANLELRVKRRPFFNTTATIAALDAVVGGSRTVISTRWHMPRDLHR